MEVMFWWKTVLLGWSQICRVPCLPEFPRVSQGLAGCLQSVEIVLRPSFDGSTDRGALRPAQISQNYLTGARAPVSDSEGLDSVAGNGDFGPDGRSNGTDGSGTGCERWLHSSATSPS